jgi:hypothetical protein
LKAQGKSFDDVTLDEMENSGSKLNTHKTRNKRSAARHNFATKPKRAVFSEYEV